MATKRETKSLASKPDEIRGLILGFLYEHHRNARGVRAQEIKITDLQREMKSRYLLGSKDVAASLDYLVQKGWVLQIERARQYTTPGGTVVPREQVTYKISYVGIDQVEGESRFRKQSPFAAVNIANVQGAVVVGDHNVINNQFVSLAERLTRLEQALATTDIPDEEKVAVIGDIETIRSQLAKPKPDSTIVQRAWNGVEAVVTAHGLAQLLVGVSDLIRPLFS